MIEVGSCMPAGEAVSLLHARCCFNICCAFESYELFIAFISCNQAF